MKPTDITASAHTKIPPGFVRVDGSLYRRKSSRFAEAMEGLVKGFVLAGLAIAIGVALGEAIYYAPAIIRFLAR